MKKEIFNGLKYVVISSLANEIKNNFDEYRIEILSVMHVLNKFLDYDMYKEYMELLDGTSKSTETNENISRIRNKVIETLDKVEIADELSKIEMMHILYIFLDPEMYSSYVQALDNFSYSKKIDKIIKKR